MRNAKKPEVLECNKLPAKLVQSQDITEIYDLYYLVLISPYSNQKLAANKRDGQVVMLWTQKRHYPTKIYRGVSTRD